jgi:hypothetical protein
MSRANRAVVFALALTSLLRAKILLSRSGWRTLVRTLPPIPTQERNLPEEQVRLIMDTCFLASRALPLTTECLERSYATCSVLRRFGVPSELCVGVRRLPPLQFHAWTAVRDTVVSDGPMSAREYLTIARM